MKYFKSFLLTIFTLFAFIACDTDDLRNDVDDLRGRVESLEAQIGLLNENMTTIKRLLEGGQTISEVTMTATGYTLKLSNGEILTLTQGSEGKVKYPKITVNGQGQWVVNGEVLMQNGVPVQAVGISGENGIIPKFRITDNGNYWQVSYDNEATWQDVFDENGNRVSAVSTDGGSSVSDSFFESAGVEGDFFIVRLKGQLESISIPIVKDLQCEIVEPETGMDKGYWVVKCGETVTTTVKIKGADNVLTTAPAGWVVTISEIINGEATLTLTAPVSISMTRAIADNGYDVTVQVNKGANWAVDKIQVKALQVIKSYKALYDAGETLIINDIAVNKETFGEATLITADNTDITAAGVYFIEPGVEAQYKGTGSYAQMIIIGNSSSEKSTLKVASQMKLTGTSNSKPEVFICQNINFDSSSFDNYPLAQFKNGTFGNVVFNSCSIIIHEIRPLTYISSSERSIGNFSVENCTFPIAVTSGDKFIISLSNSTAVYGNISFKNNVFYCSEEGGSISKFKLINGSKATVNEMSVQNNTFVNIYSDGSLYVRLTSLPKLNLSNNLFWAKALLPNSCGVFSLANKPELGTCTANICYKGDNTLSWQAFSGGISNGFIGAEEITTITADPFDGGTFDLSSGLFIPSSEYSAYGASIN